MDDQILVSVIIPNYNHAKYLKTRIDSVLNQTFQKFEVLILDDCSTDNSKEVINQYNGHPKVSHIILNESNSGSTFIQWQKGISLAKGEWIWIAESDDWAENNFLDTLLNVEENAKNTVLRYGQSYTVNELKKEFWAQYKGNYMLEIFDGKDFVSKKMLPFSLIWNASQAIFKKSCFENISNEYTHYKYCGDWVFWIDIALQGDVLIAGKFINYFRKHGNDVTSKAIKEGYRYEEEIKALDYFAKNPKIDFNPLHYYALYVRFLEDEKKVDQKASQKIKILFKDRVSPLRYYYRKYIKLKN